MKPALAELSLRILSLLKKIPRGKVASYGQIATLAGSPRGARQVVRLLHSLGEKEKLPWHRVINSTGRISLPMQGAGGLQRSLLLREKVEVSAAGKIDLDRFGWKPARSPRR
ncbi:MAG TPA: MGMT family protein [Fibrobacteria bacterium]|nr:MGMT family protein [Fibrobacteria bacterium]